MLSCFFMDLVMFCWDLGIKIQSPLLVLDTTFAKGGKKVKKWKCQSLSHVDSLWPHGLQPTRFLSPWNSPDKTSAKRSHFLLQDIFMSQDQTWTSCTARRFFTARTTRKAFHRERISQSAQLEILKAFPNSLFLIYLNWRIIALQYCDDFCHTSIWISHMYKVSPPPQNPTHLPPTYSSRLSQNTFLGALFYTSNSHWLSFLYMVICMFIY